MKQNPRTAEAKAGGVAERPLLFCGDLDIRIAADGTWYHDGVAIRRPALIKLFASVLKRDDGGDYWLVTPVERARIKVDDAPFLAVELRVEGTRTRPELVFRTNLDDWVTAGPSHPLEFRRRPNRADMAPYVAVRDGLDALVTRAVFYELAERAIEAMRGGTTRLGVESDGCFFPLEPEESS